MERYNCPAKFISAAREIPFDFAQGRFFGTKSLKMTPIAGFVPWDCFLGTQSSPAQRGLRVISISWMPAFIEAVELRKT